jgi:hypothetical protein
MKHLFIAAMIFNLTACSGGGDSKGNSADSVAVSAAGELTAEEARAIAKEAYTYGYPLVDGYRIQYAYFVAKDNTEYRGPHNVLFNSPRVYTPADVAVQTPNSDTPYSMLGLDLRSEPMVITVPVIDKKRYYSIQLIDNYTHNFDYIGTRTTGNGGGNFLIAGPNWKGEIPKGITKIIQCETEMALAIYRTQLFNPADLNEVKKVQAGYKVQPLSTFLGQTAPQAAPAIDFIQPLSPDQLKASLQFFNVLNFQLQFCPTHPSETVLMERFAKIGIGAGKQFDTTKFSPEIKGAIHQGIADAWSDFRILNEKISKRELNSGQLFGTREFLKNNYGYRMAGAIVGIYGNSREEAMYPIYSVDAEGLALNGTNKYTIRFAPGQLPPVNAFWSMTMYKMPVSLLVANPINRYLINSPMLPQLKKDSDGGITLYIQNQSPGKSKEANWLPAPEGPFMTVLRLYFPKEEALNGTWTQPHMMKIQ